ncbi:MAG: LysR family transcriptional regulator [Deltaproteobacteria bacterium]|nr:LysR family transcriptional regulator [Deltaproteobacteria bacterium]
MLYFWVTATEGSIANASKLLHVTPQTISSQIKSLEETLGVHLLEREGRGLKVTDAGRTTKEYADGIFSLTRELEAALRGDVKNPVRELRVGVSDALPKLVCHRLLEPVLHMAEKVRLVCREHGVEQLLADLALHNLDVVLNDAPIPQGLSIRAYNHLLGESGVVWVAAPKLAKMYGKNFPFGLKTAPFLLPTEDTALRHSLNVWLVGNDIQPNVVAEIADSALLKAFGENGDGIFPVATVVLQEVQRHYHVVPLGPARGVVERFYAISVERRIKHPAVVEISRQAKTSLFGVNTESPQA